MRKKTTNPTDVSDTAFAKARYEYCCQLYEREQERKETLEKKAQFYLSLVTLFFGALILNIDFITKISQLLQSKSSSQLTVFLYVVVSVFFVGLVIALLSILFSVQVRGYFIEHPSNLVSALYDSTSEYLSSKTEDELYTSTAKSYALATESDRVVNARKSEWVRLSSFFLLIALLSFVIAYGIVIYLELN